MPGTPFIALSIGVATVLAHTSAFAPVYLAVTTTDGGTISGNCVTGSPIQARTPTSVMSKDITNESIGLFIKISNMILFLPAGMQGYSFMAGTLAEPGLISIKE
jgi:hypothetical protein